LNLMQTDPRLTTTCAKYYFYIFIPSDFDHKFSPLVKCPGSCLHQIRSAVSIRLSDLRVNRRHVTESETDRRTERQTDEVQC